MSPLRNIGQGLVPTLARVAAPRLIVVSLMQTAWWLQAPVLLALSAPTWAPVALGVLLSPVRAVAQQRLRRVVRAESIGRTAKLALARPVHSVPESDSEAAFALAFRAESAVSTSLPLAVATSVTAAVSLAVLARTAGIAIAAGLLALLAATAIAILLSTRALLPRATAAVDACRNVAVWLAAALRGGCEIRGRVAHDAYLAHVRDAVGDWCRAENFIERRRNGVRAAIGLIALGLAAALAPVVAPSLHLNLAADLTTTVAVGALVSAGYAAMRALSDLWITAAELRRLETVLSGEVQGAGTTPQTLAARPIALRARGLELGYGARVVFRAPELTIPLEGLVLITGPNGAGKSTFASAVAGMLSPRAGSLAFADRDENLISCRAVASDQLGFVPQEPVLIETLSIRDNMALAVPSASDEALLNALGRVGIRHSLDHRVGAMSRGERQRVGLARALVADPLVLVLDEPDAWLDADGRALLCEVLRDEVKRRVIVVVSHRGEFQDLAHCRVAIADAQVTMTSGRFER